MNRPNSKRLAATVDADLKREEILDTAAAIFAERGFHAAGMRELCAAVELSPGAFYRYFASKEDIISALIQRDRQQTRAWFAEIPPQLGLIEALTMVLRSAIASIAAKHYMAIWAEIQAEAARNPKVRELVEGHSREAEDTLTALVENAVQRRSIASDVNPRDAAKLVLITFDGLMVRHSYDTEFDFPKTARTCLQFVAHALGAPQPRTAIKA
jgi:AcrR family transcriptional regulator